MKMNQFTILELLYWTTLLALALGLWCWLREHQAFCQRRASEEHFSGLVLDQMQGYDRPRDNRFSRRAEQYEAAINRPWLRLWIEDDP